MRVFFCLVVPPLFSWFGFVCGAVVGHSRSFCISVALWLTLFLCRVSYIFTFVHLLLYLISCKEFLHAQRHTEDMNTSERAGEEHSKFGRENRQRETRRENRPSADSPTNQATKLPLYAYETYQNQQQHKYIYRII